MNLPPVSALVLKLAAGLTLCAGVFGVVWCSQVDSEGPVRRNVQRYLSYLDRKRRTLFLQVSAGQIALVQLAVFLTIGAVMLCVTFQYWYVPLAVVAAAPALYLERERRRRVLELEKQLDSFMLALANALKSIPGVTPAFQSVAETSPLPIRQELELCNREMRVGSTLDEALLHMAARVGSSRLDSALMAIVLGRQIGGNLPRVLESTASSVREISRLEGVLRTKTSEAKMQMYVIGAAPFFLLLTLSVISPGYFEPLTQSAIGYMVGIGACGSWLFALYLARKVLSVSL